MSYLNFNKSELVNLEYSLQREILSTNRTGGYCNTTLVGCNTRKYHGLFVLPVDKFGGKRYVLLSGMDETLIQHEHEFNLGIRCYGDSVFEPRGHKYICDFDLDKSCSIVYRVGGMLFRKSLLFVHNEEQLLIRYTLIEAHSPTILRLKPFLAYREIHELTHANENASRRYETIENGTSFCMYDGFPTLNIQLNKKNEFVSNPDWYYKVVYKEEKRRGFEHTEDLYNPGYYELPIRKGQSVIVSVSTKAVDTKGLTKRFDTECKSRMSRDNYENCLKLAAKQFIVNRNGEKEIYSGYSWLGKGLRETLISLPGLTIMDDGDTATFDAVLESTYKLYQQQLLNGSRQADAALWLFWVAQQYSAFTGDPKAAWTKFKKILKEILKTFTEGKRMGVRLDDNGLLWVKMNGVAMTWMNAYDQAGQPITERAGYQVEVNSLWYNAIAYAVDMDGKYGRDKKSLAVWKSIKEKIEANFYNTFWSEERHHLADYVDEKGQNIFTRPSQVFACALDYSPINEEVKAMVVNAIKKELLTTRGLRTLSPKNPLYKGIYDGNQNQRDHAYHQGSTRVWLLPYYIEANLKLYGEVFVRKAVELADAFEEDMTVHGVGSICELYDGDPPHFPHGAISSSVAVAGILRSKYLISKYKKEE